MASFYDSVKMTMTAKGYSSEAITNSNNTLL